MDSEIPSKTDDAVSVPTAQEEPRTVQLSAGEFEYLRGLQEQNKHLTLVVGDKAMEYEMVKKALSDHRDTLINSHRSILNVHGVPNGRIDLSSGTILLPK